MNVLQAVEEAYRAYEGEKGYIGFSENGAGIPYFLIGRGAPVVLAQFSMHAREYITSYLALHYLGDLVKSPVKGSVYLLPLMNPDGVKICLSGHPLYKAECAGRGPERQFRREVGDGRLQRLYAGRGELRGALSLFGERDARAARLHLRRPPGRDAFLSRQGGGDLLVL